MESKRIEDASTNPNSDLPSTSASGGEPEACERIYAVALDKKYFKQIREEKPHKPKPRKRKLQNCYKPSKYFRPNLQPIPENPKPWQIEDMQLLCRFIRDHDEDNFFEFVWNHPHLLYCAETLLAEEHLPAVDHEGAEYNLLQIAVIFNSPFFCQLILDILEHPHFPKRLFPTKIEEDYAGEILHVMHLYLNSGSVKTGDTPLHLAAKFGFTNCCKIFLSHPLCEMDIRNVDGLTPSQVICMNVDESSSRLFQDLTDLFNDGNLLALK